MPHVVARAFAATLGIPAPVKKSVGEKQDALPSGVWPFIEQLEGLTEGSRRSKRSGDLRER